jgi:hypothetical protein
MMTDVMTEQEFDAELAHIEKEYSGSRAELEAKRDQQIAYLFVKCKWHQKDIAKHMGWSQQKVSRRLIFGRFLNYQHVGNSKLPPEPISERRFNDAWSRAGKGDPKDTEDDRFGRVVAILGSMPPSNEPPGYKHLCEKPGIRKAVVEAITSNTRQTVAQITETVIAKIPEAGRPQIYVALRGLQEKPPEGFALDARHSGHVHKYRLVPKKKPSGPPVTASFDEILSVFATILPLIAECIEILRQPEVGRQTTLALDHLGRIQKTLKRLTKEEAVV